MVLRVLRFFVMILTEAIFVLFNINIHLHTWVYMLSCEKTVLEPRLGRAGRFSCDCLFCKPWSDCLVSPTPLQPLFRWPIISPATHLADHSKYKCSNTALRLVNKGLILPIAHLWEQSALKIVNTNVLFFPQLFSNWRPYNSYSSVLTILVPGGLDFF